MQIDHTGFVYRVAYPFKYKPSRVNPCQLIWRLPIVGSWWFLVSFCTWVVFGAIF